MKKKINIIVLTVLMLFSSMPLQIHASNPSDGKINIKAIDNTGKSLSSFEFEVKDKSGRTVRFKEESGKFKYSPDGNLSSVKTNVAGLAMLIGLPYDYYSVVDVNSDTNYVPVSSVEKVNIFNGNVNNIKFDYKKDAGSAQISFTNENNNSSTTSLSLVNKSGEVIRLSSYSGVFKPNKNGSPSFNVKSGQTVSLDDIPAGVYTVKQNLISPNKKEKLSSISIAITAGSSGSYSLTNDKVVVESKPNEKPSTPSEKPNNNKPNNKPSEKPTPPVNNKSETSSISIINIDDNGKSLIGAKFIIKDSKGKELSFNELAENLYEVVQHGNRKDISIRNDKKVVIKDLPYGVYTVEQTSSRKGYKVDDLKLTKVEENSNEDLIFVNVETKSTLTFVVKNNNGDVVPGFKFNLLNDKKQSIKLKGSTGFYEMESGGAVDVLETNNDGEITIVDMNPGKYYFRETAPAPGYAKETKLIPFNVKKEETTEVNYTVYKSGATLAVLGPDGDPVEDSKITIYDAGTNQPKYEGKTDNKGIVDFGDLPDGDYFYQVKEVSSPYAFDFEEKYSFTVKNKVVSNLDSPNISYTTLKILNKTPLERLYVAVDQNGNQIEANQIQDDKTKQTHDVFVGLEYGKYKIHYKKFEGMNLNNELSKDFIEVEIDSSNHERSQVIDFSDPNDEKGNLENHDFDVKPNEPSSKGLATRLFLLFALFFALGTSVFVAYKKGFFDKFKKNKKDKNKKDVVQNDDTTVSKSISYNDLFDSMINDEETVEDDLTDIENSDEIPYIPEEDTEEIVVDEDFWEDDFIYDESDSDYDNSNDNNEVKNTVDSLFIKED